MHLVASSHEHKVESTVSFQFSVFSFFDKSLQLKTEN
jgi:hypothetical protein